MTDLQTKIESVDWYHSIDMGDGIITLGHYDHRPYLPNYRLPANLDGKTALDIGTASRRCFELMTASAGFAGIEWISDFRLNYRDGREGPYHGVIHAYKTDAGWTPQTISSRELIDSQS
ncbi:MAG: hypothetical protein ACYC6O_10255 [Thermoleophilia bacterium]